MTQAQLNALIAHLSAIAVACLGIINGLQAVAVSSQTPIVSGSVSTVPAKVPAVVH